MKTELNTTQLAEVFINLECGAAGAPDIGIRNLFANELDCYLKRDGHGDYHLWLDDNGVCIVTEYTLNERH